MVVCVDIDSVLNDLMPKSLALYNKRTGKNITMDQLTAYNLYECLNEEDSAGIIRLFEEEELWNSLMPLKGSQSGLQKLCNKHDVYLATATHEINFKWKCDWIKKYFSFFDTNKIIRIKNKALLRCDIMVDDHLSNLINNIGCERVVLSYPWNISLQKDYTYSIYRCENWSDIVNTINEIERKMEEDE